MMAEEPVQRIHEQLDFAIGYDEIREGERELEDIINNFIRPFDLSRPPLLRVRVVKIEIQDLSPSSRSSSYPLLLLDMHHIITDGISQDILTKEFMLLYAGEGLSPAPV